MSRRPATPSLLRSLNDRSALELLLREGPLTRVGLGKRIGLSKVTASQLLARLEQRDLVQVVGTQAGTRGPSVELYASRPECAYSVGIELSPDRMKGRGGRRHRRGRASGTCPWAAGTTVVPAPRRSPSR